MTKKSKNFNSEESSITHVHNHQRGYAGLLLVAAIIIVSIMFGLYQWILSGLAELGVVNPKAAFFLLLFGGMISATFLLLGSYLANWHVEQYHRRKIEHEEARYRRLQLEHRFQSSAVAGTNEIDPAIKRRNALIVQLMFDALDGKQNFSYRKAGDYILTGETSNVGKDSRVVREALQWLLDNEAIKVKKNRNYLTDKYTSIGDVERALHNGILLQK